MIKITFERPPEVRKESLERDLAELNTWGNLMVERLNYFVRQYNQENSNGNKSTT